ncbi:hypothetical protein AZI86_15675 [Bdellovibrio bacteriovorus]|uniref:Protein kinase domain-containing protein n=1 Tax=Bdellovibrio bacteriovorus TaxID=959 RepID=A0A150WHP6_BDEBC|nr:AarF/UbiB family protein [Bdellovibrio bacteriovorus]KYG63146.1 hypothetical protein AZI86_15675 [Bdellovibrio bacteriovorus]
MLRQAVLILLFVIVAVKAAFAADSEKGLYLTFEQRMAISYALLAQGESSEKKAEIVQRGKDYLKGMLSQPIETVAVKSFADFLKAMRGEWPNTHSLALDVEILEKAGPRSIKMFTSQSPRVQKQIEDYMKWQQVQLLKMAGSEGAAIGEAAKSFGGLLKTMATNPMAQKLAEGWLLDQSEAVLADRMKELDRVGEKVAESSFAKQQDPTSRIFMQTLLSEYFARLNPSSKKLIVSSFLGGDLLMDDMKKFELMVQSSGPALQKLLQVVARQSNLPREVLAVFRRLESSVSPVPWVLVDEIVKQEKKNYDFSYFEKKPLGVGTMAQTHRAKIKTRGEQSVVPRFIKPDIALRVEEDRKILSEIGRILDSNPDFIQMQVPKVSPVVDDIIKTIVAELDQNATIERQKQAKVYERVVPFVSPEYKSELEFHVPKIHEPKTKDSKLMVQEMVYGDKLDAVAETYQDAIPGLKKAIVEAMARTWAQEALFGSGFYHSDLHQGNFMIDVKEPRIMVNILDFGMGGTISSDMQRQVMVLGVGTDILSAELIARAFWDLSNKAKNQISESDFKKAVVQKVNLIAKGKEPNISMELWMAWALNRNLALPYEFVSLNRGMAIMNKLLEDSGSALDLTKITKSIAKENPRIVYNNLVVKERLSAEDLVRLGWSEMKAMFQKEPPRLRTLGMPKIPALIKCQAVFQ